MPKIDIQIDVDLVKVNPRYKQFVKRVDAALKDLYRNHPLFSYKFKIALDAGVRLVILGMDEENAKTKSTAATYWKNQIFIYPKRCIDEDDTLIGIRLEHEYNHAFKDVIHRMRWAVVSTQMAVQSSEETDHTLPFYPYNDVERIKYQELISQGVRRIYDFAYLLQKDKNKNPLLSQEPERLERYKIATQNHPVILRHMVHTCARNDQLLDAKLRTAINSRQIRYTIVQYDQRYNIEFEICKIEEVKERDDQFMLSGYYQLVLGSKLPAGEERNYHLFIGEVLARLAQIGDSYKGYEIFGEYYARTFSELTEREIMCFYPELVEYDDLDTKQAFSVGTQKVYDSVYTIWQERYLNDSQLYRRYADVPNPSFVLPLQSFFANKGSKITISSHYQNPTKPISELEAHNVDVVFRAQTDDDFEKLLSFFRPWTDKTELYRGTKELVIRSANVEPETFIAFTGAIKSAIF